MQWILRASRLESGKAYLLIELTDCDLADDYHAKASTDQGYELPCDIYLYNEISIDPLEYFFVLVIPALDVPIRITLQLNENNKLGLRSQAKPLRLSLNPDQLRRVADKSLHREWGLTESLHEFDRQRSMDQVSIFFREAIEDEPEEIICGTLHAPKNQGGAVELELFDRNGEPIKNRQTIKGDRFTAPQGQRELTQREIEISIRIPRTGEPFYAALKDSSGGYRKGFASIDDAELERMRAFGYSRLLNAGWDEAYNTWFLTHRITPQAIECQRTYHFNYNPRFSLIVPLYQTPLLYFYEMVESVVRQTYPYWELILVNGSPDNHELSEAVAAMTCLSNQIKVITLEKNLGISLNTAAGIEVAQGDFIAMLDHDDLIEPDLLFEYIRALNDDPTIDVLYCDEDHLSPNEIYVSPAFKPDYSPDLLRNNNYICHMLTLRASLLHKLLPLDARFDGAQDYELVLHASEYTDRIHHVAKVLYHWRMSTSSASFSDDNKPYAVEAGRLALQTHFDRIGVEAMVNSDTKPYTYDVRYALSSPQPSVSIVIPSHNHVDYSRRCIESILKLTTYENYEILIVDNGSDEPSVWEYYRSLEAQDRIRILSWNHPFNFSQLVNFGVAQAYGDYVLLLNNDTELLTPDWLERMVGICQRPDVGAVGARLYYPDDTVQHAGIAILPIGPVHLNLMLPGSNAGYYRLGAMPQNFCAVTGACLMTKRLDFQAVNGFDESLAVAYNDVDFCLKLRQIGKLIVYTPKVELYHFESVSRGHDDLPENIRRYKREYFHFMERWSDLIVSGDPYYNRNLNQNWPFYHLAWD